MIERRTGQDRRQADRRDANAAQAQIVQTWLAKSPSDREGDFQRYKLRMASDARKRRILRGERSATEAICGMCDLLRPKKAFNPCEWEKPEGRKRYCKLCRNGRRKVRRDHKRTVKNSHKGDRT